MRKMIVLPDYIPDQIKLEEQYYKRIHAIGAGLITYLLFNINLYRYMNIAKLSVLKNSYIDKNSKELQRIAKEQARDIIYLVNDTLNNDRIKNRSMVDSLAEQINVVQDNMLNTIWGQFIGLMPVGVTGAYNVFFTDDTTQGDIYTRANSHIKKLCVNVHGQGVFNNILWSSQLDGYSEYIGDNQHDDRVRPLHRKYFNGELWISFNNPPPCGHIATEWGCRCRIIALR
jgi:hypothetical protein